MLRTCGNHQNYSNNEVDFSRGGIPQPKDDKRMTTTYKIKGKNHTFHHIEKKFKLKTHGQIELDGKEI